MIYVKSITTPANTLQTSPLRSLLEVTKGVVYKLELRYPSGSVGLMGVQIKHHEFNVWPIDKEEWFTGNDEQISYEDLFLVEERPYEFDIYTYNEDDTYEHGVQLRLGVVSREIFVDSLLPTKGFEKIADGLEALKPTDGRPSLERAIPLIEFIAGEED